MNEHEPRAKKGNTHFFQVLQTIEWLVWGDPTYAQFSTSYQLCHMIRKPALNHVPQQLHKNKGKIDQFWLYKSVSITLKAWPNNKIYHKPPLSLKHVTAATLIVYTFIALICISNKLSYLKSTFPNPLITIPNQTLQNRNTASNTTIHLTLMKISWKQICVHTLKQTEFNWEQKH